MASRPARLTLHLMVTSLVAGLLLTWPVPSATADGLGSTGGDRTLDILVLGDSYSAGNGATDDQGAEQTYGPDGCRRSTVNWSEKYAAMLRLSGQPVRLVNHACSGGVTADITSPRVMETANKGMVTPAGVSTTAQADAYLAATDPCNTHAFPTEEFWTYHATAVTPLLTYACTRNLRPQADFVTPDVDLVLFTMGGNDAGFSTIVQNCFLVVARNSSACKTTVDAARALLPQIRQRLLSDITAIRAHGLRNDAKMVQLGYPWLQQDNNFTLSDPPGYDAGNQVRSLVSDGDAAIGGIVPDANAGHPGQLSFLTGVPEKFSGHEPDATTPVGNPVRWINQVGDGSGVDVWYHPNRLGQTAYAELLATHGTFGAPTGPAVTASVRTRFTPHGTVHRGRLVHLRVKVRLSDGSRPRGRVVVRGLPGHRRLAAEQLRKRDHGVLRLTFRVRNLRTTEVQVVYRDRVAPAVVVEHRVRVRR
ncbi:MAG: hypothetical protein JWO46_772 [Nocardioidaceae bacterium]|nr:hypothetical protein [Nocardioidaceae bacterium]